MQTINFVGSPTGGTFTLTFGGLTTAAITWSGTTATLQTNIQNALNALRSFPAGVFVVSNAANPTITFQAALGGTNLPPMTVGTNSLTGGTSPTLTIATTTVGGYLPAIESPNALQTLTFGASNTGGTFTLNFDGQTTAAITYSATANTLESNIQTALVALSNIGANNVVVTATSSTVVTVVFQNVLGGQNVPVMTASTCSDRGHQHPDDCPNHCWRLGHHGQ